jgi:uncharacterized protein (DUF2147 family)
MRKHVISFLLSALLLSGLTALAGADDILGVWNTTDDKSKVQIYKQGNRYSGKIIGLKEPNWPANDELGMGGKPKTDRRNPKPGLHHRPIVGMQIMSGFIPAENHLWVDGKIYDPESGKTYKCKMTLVSTNRLEVRGYVGFSLMGRTVVWTR